MEEKKCYIGETNFRNQKVKFYIKTDDRRRHMYLLGKSGSGKSTLLENMAVQDVRSGQGLCFVDPHGDTAERLLSAIPPSRTNDLIYFNPADTQYPIAFNVMGGVSPDKRNLLASGLVGVFKKIWADSWGPRLEHILRNCILTLLEYPGSTLLGIPRLLVDDAFRKQVLGKVTDPVIRQFWTKEFANYNDRLKAEAIAPIQNKVGQFLTSSLVRNIIGQVRTSFDIREIMDNRKILIMNLSKGLIGEDASALLGAMMVTKIQLAAMERVDTPEEQRKDFYLYVDEFQNFATESFANILSEARKYRLSLVLANQYIEQVPEAVQNAIFGNCGTLIAFRVGAKDAKSLVEEMGTFDEGDFTNLPKYSIYLKLMIDGLAGQAFSATTLPPEELSEGDARKLVRVSRERYAKPKSEIEAKIKRYMV